MHEYGGVTVRINDHVVANVALDPGVRVGNEYRLEYDTWLREYFGEEKMLQDGDVRLCRVTGFLFMNSKTLKDLQQRWRFLDNY